MKRRQAQPAFMLLEVVIAVGLLVFGFAVIGAQMQNSLEQTHKTEQLARVVFLAESKFAEIDTGLIIPKLSEDIEEDFGRLFPRYAWRARIERLVEKGQSTEPEAANNLGLLYVQLDILYDPKRNPDEEFNFDEAEVAGSFYTIRAAPKPLDLTKDFGMEDDIAEKLNGDLAGMAGGDIDVREFSPDIFRNLDMDQLAEIIPTLLGAFGGKPSDILQLLPADMRPQLEAMLQDQLPSQDENTANDQGENTANDQGENAANDQGENAANDQGESVEPSGDGGASQGGNDSNPTGEDESRRGGNRRNPRGGGGRRR